MSERILGVDEFKARLQGGGVRPNLFKATINFPRSGYADGDVGETSFMCKSAVLPASQVGVIEVPFRGRVLKVGGDRTFDPWTVTVINDTDFVVRDSFERWMNGINEHKRNTGFVNPVDYEADLVVEQLDKNGDTLKKYDFRGCWPSNVSEIEVSWDANDTIEEYTVEFQVQYWEALGDGVRSGRSTTS